MYSEQIEQLIKSIIADGVITDKERTVLHKRAVAEGIDEDEIDVYVDGLIAQIKSPQKDMENNNVDMSKNTELMKIHSGDYIYYICVHPFEFSGNYIRKYGIKYIFLDDGKGRVMDLGILLYGIGKKLFRHPQLLLETDKGKIELSMDRNLDKRIKAPAEVIKSNEYFYFAYRIDRDTLRIICDSSIVSLSLSGMEDYYSTKHHNEEINNISNIVKYSQVIYRSVIDNSAYPDAVINENDFSRTSKSKKRNYDIFDVDDALAIRLITEDTTKWEIIKPRPRIMDQYKGLKGIIITDIHDIAFYSQSYYLRLKALSDKNGNNRFFFVNEGAHWKLKRDLNLIVNMEDYIVRYLQNDDRKYVYEVDASVLKEMFTTKHDISLQTYKLVSVPKSWNEAFEYLTDSNKLKEWLEKYEENKNSGIWGKLRNFLGS